MLSLNTGRTFVRRSPIAAGVTSVKCREETGRPGEPGTTLSGWLLFARERALRGRVGERKRNPQRRQRRGQRR